MIAQVKKPPNISIKEILEETPNKKIIIDLSNEMGNMDILISIGVSWCEALVLNNKKFFVTMINAPYNDALKIFQEYFPFVSFKNYPKIKRRKK